MLTIVLIPILLLVVILAFLALRQDKMIFYPEKLDQGYRFPFTFPFEELDFEPEPGVHLNAILAHTHEPRGLVFYNHGNAGNLDSWGSVCGPFLRRGYDVLVYDYRGYGKSTGRVQSQQELVQDALFIFDQIRSSYAEKKVVFYGRSLGSGVASAMAKARQPEALFLETPYASFPKLVRAYYPFVPSFLIKYKLRTEKILPELTCPVSIIHGTSDEVIPFHHSQDLVARNPSIQFFQVEGGTHNDLEMHPEYQEMLDQLQGTDFFNSNH